ncbi:class I SAM-dependent methyltransferase [Marinomonas colpomeniae]|uniref:Class I SAM-dependent methyltransferase n=1 Tax=Marinomonas colpomeniae TaxID=2774408 RepID=A0ABR8P1E2_9GAMM|nr:class I SAM-dependent methyltransferase [Marinomonas colpomeniae]MBD5771122.1 class I SAM-dependent methyltransferase [Marinomonas colpomeniae]
MQTEEPYWIDEAYSAALSVSDTGVMSRNHEFNKVASLIFGLFHDKNDCFLDYGGGYGIFVRLMRDKGYDFYWYDKYADNLVARGFEGDINKLRYAGVTSFENFEHFVNPLEDIEAIFKLTDFVLFSTTLVSTPAPHPDKWWYYCLEHGQHVSIFSYKSLEFIAKKYNYFLASNGKDLHILSKKKIPKYIFFIERIIRKSGLSFLFKNKSKTNSDMHDMIKKMNQV